jgi:uncharacterized membrane protein
MQYYLSRKWSGCIFTVLLVWILLSILAPVLLADPHPFWRTVSRYIYLLFKPTCHQLYSRSFHWGPYAFAVCIRCFAFYSAGLVISGIFIFYTRPKMLRLSIYALMVAPLLVDFLLEKTNLYTDFWPVRLITGFLAGLVFFHLLLLAISEKIHLSGEG